MSRALRRDSYCYVRRTHIKTKSRVRQIFFSRFLDHYSNCLSDSAEIFHYFLDSTISYYKAARSIVWWKILLNSIFIAMPWKIPRQSLLLFPVQLGKTYCVYVHENKEVFAPHSHDKHGGAIKKFKEAKKAWNTNPEVKKKKKVFPVVFRK